MTGISERITEFQKEEGELETLLEPIMDALLKASLKDKGGYHSTSWYLDEFYIDREDNLVMKAEDIRDGDCESVSIPCSVIDNGGIAEFCEKIESDIEAKTNKEKAKAIKNEISALEKKLKILKGET